MPTRVISGIKMSMQRVGPDRFTRGWWTPRRRRRLSCRSKYPPPEPGGGRRVRRWRPRQLVFPMLLTLFVVLTITALYLALRQQVSPIELPRPPTQLEDPFGLNSKPQ